MEINKVLPFTTSLPGVPTLLDPTVSRVQKAVMVVFATVTAVPIVVVTITLACDGMYNAYHYIYFYFVDATDGSSEKKPAIVRESFGGGGGGGGGFSSGKAIKTSPTLRLNKQVPLDLPKPPTKQSGKLPKGQGDIPGTPQRPTDELAGKRSVPPLQLPIRNGSTSSLPPVGTHSDNPSLLPSSPNATESFPPSSQGQRPLLVPQELPPPIHLGQLPSETSSGEKPPTVQQEDRSLVVHPVVQKQRGIPPMGQRPAIMSLTYPGLGFLTVVNGSIVLPDEISRLLQPRTSSELVSRQKQRPQLMAPGESQVDKDPSGINLEDLSMVLGALATQQCAESIHPTGQAVGREGALMPYSQRSAVEQGASRRMARLLRQWESVRDLASPGSRLLITINGCSITASVEQIQQCMDFLSHLQSPMIIMGDLGQTGPMSLVPRPMPMLGEEDLVTSVCQGWEILDPTGSSVMPVQGDIRPWLGYLRVSGNQRNEEKYSLALFHMGASLRKKFPDIEERMEKFPAQSPVYRLLHSLLVSNGTCVGTRYADLHYYLRLALQDYSAEAQGIRDVLLHISHSKYVEMSMYPFLEDYLSEVLVASQFEVKPLTFSTLSAEAREANHKLKAVPFLYQQRGIAKDWSKLLGTVGLWFDPSAGSNVSWVHSLQMTEEGRKIYVLRHGTPTQDPGVGGVVLRELGNLTSYVPLLGRALCASTWASVVPEFEAHLAADTTKQTLYVNHQEYDARGHDTSHGEGDRSQAIRNLEGSHKNFHFLALPFDGPLWKKRSEPRKVDALCKLLCDSLVNQENGFCLPKAMRNVDGNHIMAMLKQIHQLYFSGQEFATVKEEKAFIMLFYSELKDYAKMVLLIDYIVSACKDNKDRGNASTTVDMGKNVVKLGKEEDPQRLKEIFFSVLGPFIIKNEEIIGSRLEFALAVLEHLASLSPQQRQAIRETPSASGFKLAEQVVPREYAVEEVF